jgi:hypothetical protein
VDRKRLPPAPGGNSSGEFSQLWAEHHVAVRRSDRKRIIHPELGLIRLDCQTLAAREVGQKLHVFTATPGSEDAKKLELLKVIGNEKFGPDPARAASS